MKKLFTILSFVLLPAISCTRFDDSAIWEELLNHKERIEKLEAECNRLNTNINSLQTILEALQTNDYVTDIVKIMEDGVEVGYSITFAKGGTITIYHGTNGDAPKVGIQKAADGQYYWTSDGEWLTDDDGEKIPASVQDPDAGYITPQFRIAEGVWYISYDNGSTWRQIESVGDSENNIFVSVDNADKEYLILTLSTGETIYLRKDHSCPNVQSPSESFRIELTPLNYHTISQPATELLSCGPGMVSYGNGNFAVVYLADDVNTVETESSKTIVCRLRDFNILTPESGQTIDVAMAGQKTGDVVISSNKAPYEPNIIKLDDHTLLILFNVWTNDGKYVYYSARYDTVKKEITSYNPLRLDGREWNPLNIAMSYNAMADNDISSSGPSSSMVFTSKVVSYDGYHYGFCGGICKGFPGILVRSTDGINWESYLTPEYKPEMSGVIECGFQILDDYLYLCLRDISSGVYHCSYKFSTKEQVAGTSRLDGLTTSKPAVFIEDDNMYLIVNKDTGDDAVVGRRNTALFYKVDPATCVLSPAKEVFCRDGVAYHVVEKYNDTNYWCFHTDARRINPYTQGRSNLAFLPVPAMTDNCIDESEKTLVGLSLISDPQMTYVKNSSFVTKGMVLGANYVDATGSVTTHIIRNEDCTYSPALSAKLTESCAVTITYDDGKDSVRKVIVLDVKDAVSNIEIVSEPFKTRYCAGEEFVPDGMEVLATFSDNSMALVRDYTYTPEGPLASGDKQIEVSYGGKTALLDVDVESSRVLYLDDYAQYYTRGCITAASNTWVSNAGNMHYQIPLDEYKMFDTLTVTANDKQSAYIAFLTKRMTQSGPVAYAEGWTEQLIIAPSQTVVLDVPADAAWLYVLSTRASGDSMLPSSMEFSSEQ